jgi:hypothetical protein
MNFQFQLKRNSWRPTREASAVSPAIGKSTSAYREKEEEVGGVKNNMTTARSRAGLLDQGGQTKENNFPAFPVHVEDIEK